MADEVILKETECTIILGIHPNRGPIWDDQIDHICVTSGIYTIHNSVQFCCVEILKMAYFSLIHSHLQYGMWLWGSCANYKLNWVFRLRKKQPELLQSYHSEICAWTLWGSLDCWHNPSLYSWGGSVPPIGPTGPGQAYPLLWD